MLEFLSGTLDFFFPPLCPFCGHPADTEWGVCMDCETELPWLEPPWCDACGRPLDAGGVVVVRCGDCRAHPPAYDRAFSVVAYEEPAQRVLTAYKYGRDAGLAPSLSAVFLRSLPQYVNPFQYDLVTAIPLHEARLRWRGFNQAALLARSIARRFRIPFAYDAVMRGRETQAQASLDRAGRLANLAAAFQVRRPTTVHGKRILLIDDVFTTGATLEACAAVMKDSGAARVDGLTLARALPLHPP